MNNNKDKANFIILLSIVLLIIALAITLIQFSLQGLIISKTYNAEITASVGSILAGIFGPLVSLVAVFIYYQALRQDKNLFIKKEKMRLYQELYIKLNSLFYEFLKRGYVHRSTLISSLLEYKNILDPEKCPDKENYQEYVKKKWESMGDERNNLEKDIRLLKSNYYSIYHPLFQEIKCLVVRVSDPEIRFNLEVLISFYNKLLMAIDDVVNIGFQDDCLTGFSELHNSTMKKINELILFEISPDIEYENINKELSRLKLK